MCIIMCGMSCAYIMAQIFNLIGFALWLAAMFTTGWRVFDLSKEGLFQVCGKVVDWNCQDFTWREDILVDDTLELTRKLAVAAAAAFFLTMVFLIIGACGSCRRSSIPKIFALILALAAMGVSAASVGVWWEAKGFHEAYSLGLGIAAAVAELICVLLIGSALSRKDDYVVS